MPGQASITVWLAGSPYTYMRSGYALVESKPGGRIIQPSSVTPPPTGTRKNSAGRGIKAATAARWAVSSTRALTTWCPGIRTRSTVGGRSKRDQV